MNGRKWSLKKPTAPQILESKITAFQGFHACSERSDEHAVIYRDDIKCIQSLSLGDQANQPYMFLTEECLATVAVDYYFVEVCKPA